MPTIRIPSTRRWTGPYLGNYFGHLWKTFNVDLDREEGRITLSRRLDTVQDSSGIGDGTLGTITAFLRTNSDCTDRYWGLSDCGTLFKVDSSPTGAWTVDGLDSSPTNAKDMAMFENDTSGDAGRQILFVTRDSTVAALNDTGTRVWNGTWWTGTALKTGIPHPITYFPFRRIMLIGDANRIHTISRVSSTSATTITQSRLILPTELQIQHIFTTTNRAWILCANLHSGNGKIVEWDGFSETYNAIHDAYSKVPLSGVNYKEIPIVLNHKGIFLEYAGNGFIPMIRNGQEAAFPIARESHNAFLPSETELTAGIKPRGMTVGEDGLIYINAIQPNNASYRQGAGIWCLNPVTGRLYNKYSLGQWGSGNTDFGQQRISGVGAIYPIPFGASNRSFLVGGTAHVNFDVSSKNAIWVLADNSNTTAMRGYFITQWISANEIRDFWDSLWIHFRRFITAANRIVVKARGTRPLVGSGTLRYLPSETNITWTGASTFTVTLATTDDALAVGDEVEVIAGDNAGTLSHITVISGAHAALQTITIDETLTASTNAARARFDRWKKLGTISDASVYEFSLPIGITSSFVQFKVEMRGPSAEMEISDLIINSQPSVFSKK